MFLVVLFGLAATTAALPIQEMTQEKEEGINIPIYKPVFNPYGFNVFGPHFSQREKGNYPNFMYGPSFYDFMEYFNKFYPFFSQQEANRNIFRPTHGMKGMMSHIYMNEQENMYPEMDYSQGWMRRKYRPRHNYGGNFYNPQHNYYNNQEDFEDESGEGYNYPYKPYFPGFPPNFVDMSSPYYDMNFRDLYRDFCKFYMDNMFRLMNNYATMGYPAYNNFIRVMRYGPFPRFDVKPKTVMRSEEVEEVSRSEPVVQPDLKDDVQTPEIEQPVVRTRRDVESTEEVNVDANQQNQQNQQVEAVKLEPVVAPQYAYLARFVPPLSVTPFPFYDTYDYQPWWNNLYYVKK